MKKAMVALRLVIMALLDAAYVYAQDFNPT
jgi:hypothetical protein